MYFENRPVAPVIEKTVYESDGHYGGGNRGTREKANTALGFGIAGTVLGLAALWGRGNNGIGSLLGGGGSGSGSGTPTNININGGDTSYSGGGCGHVAPTAFEAYSKSCEDAIALTSAFYNQRINSLQEATAARNVDIAEKFGLYQSQITADFGLYKDNRDNIDRVSNRINDELFSLYKYTRDKDDETNNRLCKLEKEVAVNSAVRPYQDKLIQCEIDRAYTAGINYVDRRTCKMLEGIVTLPLEPTVTGAVSQTCCNRFLAATAAGGGGAAAG